MTSWIVGYLLATAVGALLIYLLGRRAPFDDDAP